MLLENAQSLIEPLVRYFLGIFFLMIGLQFTARTLGLYARHGFSHINYGTAGSAGWWHRQLFNLFRSLILAAVVARLFIDIDHWFGVFPALYHWPVLLTGMLFLMTAFTLVNYMQAYMDQDWRSGVDRRQNRNLLTSGPFGRSRNPLFLTVMLGQLGFFLALPSVFSLVCLITGVVVLMRQAQIEEQALALMFGNAYEDYRQRVPRWL